MHQRREQDDAEGHAGGDRRARHAGEAPDGVRGTPRRAAACGEGTKMKVSASMSRALSSGVFTTCLLLLLVLAG